MNEHIHQKLHIQAPPRFQPSCENCGINGTEDATTKIYCNVGNPGNSRDMSNADLCQKIKGLVNK